MPLTLAKSVTPFELKHKAVSEYARRRTVETKTLSFTKCIIKFI